MSASPLRVSLRFPPPSSIFLEALPALLGSPSLLKSAQHPLPTHPQHTTQPLHLHPPTHPPQHLPGGQPLLAGADRVCVGAALGCVVARSTQEEGQGGRGCLWPYAALGDVAWREGSMAIGERERARGVCGAAGEWGQAGDGAGCWWQWRQATLVQLVHIVAPK